MIARVLKIAINLAGFLPEKLVVFGGAIIGVIASFFLPGRWLIALKNLRQAFPQRSRRWRLLTALKHFAHLGSMTLLTAHVLRKGKGWFEEHLRLRGVDLYEEARRKGSGVIILTAHVGNWELGGFAHAIRYGGLCTVGRPVRNSKVEELLVELRSKMRMHQVPFHGSFYQMSRILRAKRDVAILPDHNTPYEKALFVEFFNKPASFPRSPYLLMKRTGAPAVIAFTNFKKGSLCVEYLSIIEDAATPEEFFSLYSRALEVYIRRYPEQYLWMHDRWKNIPPASSSEERNR